MRGGQEARRERLDAIDQRALEIHRADDTVFGGAERQVHHRHRQAFGSAGTAASAMGAGGGRRVGVAVVGTVGDGLHGRQQLRERAHGGALGGAAMAGDQNATDRGVYDSQQDRQRN